MTWIYLTTLTKKKFERSAWISWIKTKILKNFLQSKVKQYKNLLLKLRFKTSDLEELRRKLGVEIQWLAGVTGASLTLCKHHRVSEKIEVLLQLKLKFQTQKVNLELKMVLMVMASQDKRCLMESVRYKNQQLKKPRLKANLRRLLVFRHRVAWKLPLAQLEVGVLDSSQGIGQGQWLKERPDLDSEVVQKSLLPLKNLLDNQYKHNLPRKRFLLNDNREAILIVEKWHSVSKLYQLKHHQRWTPSHPRQPLCPVFKKWDLKNKQSISKPKPTSLKNYKPLQSMNSRRNIEGTCKNLTQTTK